MRPKPELIDHQFKVALGATIHQLRLEKNIPSGRFAKSLGISYPRYWKYEYGKQMPTLLTLLRIIERLECGDGYFFELVRRKTKDLVDSKGENNE